MFLFVFFIGDDDNNNLILPDLHIVHNEKCSIYVLQPFRFGTVSGCSDCTIVVGAVEAVLSLERCERVTLIASCNQLRISNSFDCKYILLYMYIHTHTHKFI